MESRGDSGAKDYGKDDVIDLNNLNEGEGD